MHTLIVTFYGYKGGTGRTLALANVARFLADELGYRVGLIDLDLESPGLVHEPLCPGLDSDSEDRRRLLDKIDQRPGFIECYLDRISDLAPRSGAISDYVFPLSSGGGGGIILMPAARGSVSKRYGLQLNNFVAALSPKIEPLEERDGPTSNNVNLASHVTWTVLEDFAEQYQLDFLFVDGRTGAGPFFSPVYMYAVPHLLVLFCGLNDQNIQGSIATLQTTDVAASDEVPILLVISPVPTVGPAKLEERLGFLRMQLAEAKEGRKSGLKYRYKLPHNADYFLPYSDAAAFGEFYFAGTYPNSALAEAYRKLSAGIANLVIRQKEEVCVERTKRENAASIGPERVHVALELVHADVLEQPRLLPGLEFKLHSYISENPDSAWEKLRNFIGSEGAKEQLLDELPDVVVLPQTHLQTLARKPGTPLLYSLNELRKKVGDRYRALDFEFLDTHFLNWRHWCSDERALAGLPFSVNAMLLCCDADQLRPICKMYWEERGPAPNDPFFLPSNWNAVAALLGAGIAKGIDKDKIFRMVRSERGFYYDWLNYTASMGGFDLIQSEGRLTQVVALGRKATIEATKSFLRLARICGRGDTMDGLITAFARRELAMYVGWTDSFRFVRAADGVLSRVSVTASGDDRKNLQERPQDIRLGHIPRDMRYSRNTLVDGWLMTFPRKKNEDHLPRALEFANRILEPEVQRSLLRKGFPSPSAWVIEQELDALYSQRLSDGGSRKGRDSVFEARAAQSERCYEVFLETMKLAIHSGKWIASSTSKPPIEKALAEILNNASDDEARVAREICKLAKTINVEAEN